jgi:hypothetical protein
MKPGQGAKTDFFDKSCLLILRKLQKAKERPDNPAYIARPLFFNNLRTSCDFNARPKY